MKDYKSLHWIITHEEEETLTDFENVGLKLEQACKPILGRQEKEEEEEEEEQKKKKKKILFSSLTLHIHTFFILLR
jgi:hypothetical protein